jgi:small subunit ribosomal protein S14
MLSSKKKDFKIRNSFNKIEKINKVKKFLKTNLLSRNFYEKTAIPTEDLAFPFLKHSKKMRSKLRVKIVNRCVINNRNRGVFRPFGISRVLMRNLMQFGLLPGYSKAVW